LPEKDVILLAETTKTLYDLTSVRLVAELKKLGIVGMGEVNKPELQTKLEAALKAANVNPDTKIFYVDPVIVQRTLDQLSKAELIAVLELKGKINAKGTNDKLRLELSKILSKEGIQNPDIFPLDVEVDPDTLNNQQKKFTKYKTDILEREIAKALGLDVPRSTSETRGPDAKRQPVIFFGFKYFFGQRSAGAME
jgi:hypothetical protein